MGIGLNASARPPRCATAVSQAMRAIRDQGVCRQPAWDLARNRGASGYRVLVASDFALRERAARLAYRVYAANATRRNPRAACCGRRTIYGPRPSCS